MNCWLPVLAILVVTTTLLAAEEDQPKKSDRELIQGIWEVVAIEAGGQKAPDDSFKEKRFLIDGDRFSLSGTPKDLRTYRLDQTASRAEFVCMALQTAPAVTLIGSQTAGADGDVSYLVLPGGIVTTFSGLGVFYPDGRRTQRIGIVPDILVRPTVASLRRGEDEVLSRAVRFLKDDP